MVLQVWSHLQPIQRNIVINEDSSQQLSHCQWLHAFWYVLVYTAGVWHNANKPFKPLLILPVSWHSPVTVCSDLQDWFMQQLESSAVIISDLRLAALHRRAYSSSISDWSLSQTPLCRWEQWRISLYRGLMLKHLLNVDCFVTKSVLCFS